MPRKPLPIATGRTFEVYTFAGRRAYPFRYMFKGDTFVEVPKEGQSPSALANIIRTAARQLARRFAPGAVVFEVRVVVENGRKVVRCWKLS